MFGITRFILAISVLIFHLSEYSKVIGYYSVQGFFILSGYLMTLVMRERYFYTIKGTSTFILKRISRIIPNYFISLFICFLIILFDPLTSAMCHPSLLFPNDISQWLSNFFLFGQGSASKLIPPGWSLLTEFIYYILISIILSKYNLGILFWFFLSLVYTIYLNIETDRIFWLRELYFSPLASSLPFSLGAVLYLLNLKFHFFKRMVQNNLCILIPNIILIMMFILTSMTISPQEVFLDFKISYYLNFIFISFIILFLANIRDFNNKLTNLDSLLGSTSYPLYLLHWPIFALINSIFWRLSLPNHSVILIISTCFVIIILSFLLLNPLENLIKRKLNLIIFEK